MGSDPSDASGIASFKTLRLPFSEGLRRGQAQVDTANSGQHARARGRSLLGKGADRLLDYFMRVGEKAQKQSVAASRTQAPALGRGVHRQVARELGIGPRALQSRLRAERTSFQLLLDEARRETALREFAEGRSSLSELAFLLGYSEQSAFQRAFKRWTGSTPGTQSKSAGRSGLR